MSVSKQSEHRNNSSLYVTSFSSTCLISAFFVQFQTFRSSARNGEGFSVTIKGHLTKEYPSRNSQIFGIQIIELKGEV